MTPGTVRTLFFTPFLLFILTFPPLLFILSICLYVISTTEPDLFLLPT
jgi:hypothetical protein